VSGGGGGGGGEGAGDRIIEKTRGEAVFCGNNWGSRR
jgi:hypothetical protein